MRRQSKTLVEKWDYRIIKYNIICFYWVFLMHWALSLFCMCLCLTVCAYAYACNTFGCILVQMCLPVEEARDKPQCSPGTVNSFFCVRQELPLVWNLPSSLDCLASKTQGWYGGQPSVGSYLLSCLRQAFLCSPLCMLRWDLIESWLSPDPWLKFCAGLTDP